MADQGSLAGLEMFDKINIDYEKAYENNDIKKACILQAISLLPQSCWVLDVGCGIGIPVASTVCTFSFNPNEPVDYNYPKKSPISYLQ
jgi:SAM-dependent methyltransferase